MMPDLQGLLYWIGGSCLGLTIVGLVIVRLVTKRIEGESRGEYVYPVRLQQVADHLQSRSVSDKSSVGGHVVWTRGGHAYYYFEMPRGEQIWSILSVKIPSGALPRFQVRPRAGTVPFPPPPQRYPREIDVEDFDRRFEIRFPRGDAATLPALGEVWYRVVLVANLCVPRRLVLEARGTSLRVCLPGALHQHREWSALLDAACGLLGAILEKYAATTTPAEGASALADVLVKTDDAAAVCPVCGEEIGAEPVKCARCATPHHRACWDYAGVCSVFGCQSTDAA